MSKAQHELPILVTGAAGRIGSVGRSVTELLLARGFRVRAQVRVDDERATRVRALGAEVRGGGSTRSYGGTSGDRRVRTSLLRNVSRGDLSRSGCQRRRRREASWRKGVRQSLSDDRQRDGHLQYD